MDWQPIETALKDDPSWLKLRGNYPWKWAEPKEQVEVVGRWEDGENTGSGDQWIDERYNPFWPTHWQPIRPPSL